jgi:DNA-binding NarL/FixJ family response regulator/tetratricopeptide (TPR) repeat protein
VDRSGEPPIVGRRDERAAIAAALGAGAGIVVLEGEPGIGKSRLLAHLAAHAHGLVLHARASEYEADLPYALWSEALDRHLAGIGERARSRLGLADPEALAGLLPALGAGAPAEGRHRTHRALRDLLERLAAARPLVLCLDDVHWADPASTEALAALAHRPPDAGVVVALAARTGRLGTTLETGLAAAARDDRLTRLRLAPLGPVEARELVGARADDVYAASGGNPFYLEQLARTAGPVPATVAAAIGAEVAALGSQARRLLEAAAVVGDPFDAGLAAEVAELGEPAALDELLRDALVRTADAPRRFAFRHPVVRHTVYEAAPAGWRLGAHARAAAALERRAAGPVQLAHHVEQAAEPGDGRAIGLLTAAARALQSPAPGTAARYYAAALRLLPDGAPTTAIRSKLAEAQAAAGDAAASRETLLTALETAAPEERLALTVGVANAEWWLGRVDEARRRLHVTLGALPAEPSPDRIRLRLALALTSLMACDLAEARRQTADARDDARAIGDPLFLAAALAGGAIAAVADGAGPEVVDAAAEALDALAADQLATRLPAFWMLGRARRLLGDHERALRDLERGSAIAAGTGRDNVRLQLTVESVPVLIELGRLEEAAAAAEQGVELARLAGNPRTLLWARCALSSARLACGDASAAVRHATEAAESGASADFHAAGQPGWSLGAALVAAGNAGEGAAAIRTALAAVLPVERPAAAADLAEAELARGDLEAARDALAAVPATPATAPARSAVLLAEGRPGEALAAARHVPPAGAPLLAARARLAEGRALAAAGDRADAIAALVEAEAALDRFGAIRRRDEAVRELRKLGHRILRAAREPGEGPLAPLTAREREIAELVAAGRTNREVAEQLVLSARTIEAHLRNVYGKLGVRSRVELTRAVGSPPPAGG